MNLRPYLLLFSLGYAASAAGQQPRIDRIDPPFWWTGMLQDTLELLISGGSLGGATVSTPSSGIRVLSSETGGNNSYLFLSLLVHRDADTGNYPFSISTPNGTVSFPYHLRARDTSGPRNSGFGPEDVVYLITPDRFANGDPVNDSIPGMREQPNRSAPYGRHGGDLQGIIDHLPYLKDLGVTTLWINPLLENDNPAQSYHGYAATDLFRIDPRFGTNDLYCRFVGEAHRMGLKVILDHVSNHISILHPWIADLPAADWLNGSNAEHLPSFHEPTRLNDPHAAVSEQRRVVEGWFTGRMPDLNQSSPHLRRYLIQNTIWWVELSGLDGIREDTYPYCDQEYLNAWCRALLAQYPRLNIVGEVWMNDVSSTSSFQRGNRLAPARHSALPTVTDFPLYEALKATFVRKESIRAVAHCLSLDFCYSAPESLLTFVDNHDVPRLTFLTGTDIRRRAMALTVLLTTRGIPQIYYGTEVALRGGRDDGTIRSDMPGGFPGDAHTVFTDEGRTNQERDWFTFVRDLLRLRQQSPALQEGKLVHFSPIDEIYVYFRIRGTSTIMVAVNNSDSTKKVSCVRYREYLPEGSRLKHLSGPRRGQTMSADSLDLEGLSATLYDVLR